MYPHVHCTRERPPSHLCLFAPVLQQFALAGAVQVVLAALAVPVRHLVLAQRASNGWLDRFLQANVGIRNQKPRHHEFVAGAYTRPRLGST